MAKTKVMPTYQRTFAASNHKACRTAERNRQSTSSHQLPKGDSLRCWTPSSTPSQQDQCRGSLCNFQQLRCAQTASWLQQTSPSVAGDKKYFKYGMIKWS